MRPSRNSRARIEGVIDGLHRQADLADVDGKQRMAGAYRYAAEQMEADNLGPVRALRYLKRFPVTIDEFTESEDFLGSDNLEIWPSLKDDLRIMNPDIISGQRPKPEYLFGGATGTGKTLTALVTQAYQLYTLLCFNTPQELFGLQRNTRIMVPFVSVQESVANRVLYEPFRDMFTAMPFVRRFVPYDRNRESSLNLLGNIVIMPMLASVQRILGQAVISAIIDEVNFMLVVQDSKRVIGPQGQGGELDQAESIYRNMSRRRKSRFSANIPTPGTIAVLSSVRYKGDFLSRRIRQVSRNREDVPVFVHKQYEVRPATEFGGETFRLLVGTEIYETRILEADEREGEDYPEGAQVEDIPVEYRAEFQNDPENALRDVVGVATESISPFFAQRGKIMEAVVEGEKEGLVPFVVRQNLVLSPRQQLPALIEDRLPDDRDVPRFIHIDLSVKKDRCGIAMCKYLGHKDVEGISGVRERLPMGAFEMLISLKPTESQEVEIAEIRRWVLQLYTVYGFNIQAITFDGFQSTESIQTLRRAGIRSYVVSMDRTAEPYQVLRSAFYTGRAAMVHNELAVKELRQLEYFAQKDKVDHPIHGSKDISDGMAGSFFAMTRDRALRIKSGVMENEGNELRKRRRTQRRSRQRMRDRAANAPDTAMDREAERAERGLNPGSNFREPGVSVH